MTFSEPDYRLINEFDGKPLHCSFWVPTEVTGYHKSREMAMSATNVYARCGISPELLTSFADTLLQFANKERNVETIRTDIGLIANNIKFRINNIADEECALRMGAISVFMDGEDPEKVTEAWTQRKLKLAHEEPNIHAFFLHMGIARTEEYAILLRSLMAEEYFSNRNLMLDSLIVKSTPVA